MGRGVKSDALWQSASRAPCAHLLQLVQRVLLRRPRRLRVVPQPCLRGARILPSNSLRKQPLQARQQLHVHAALQQRRQRGSQGAHARGGVPQRPAKRGEALGQRRGRGSAAGAGRMTVSLWRKGCCGGGLEGRGESSATRWLRATRSGHSAADAHAPARLRGRGPPPCARTSWQQAARCTSERDSSKKETASVHCGTSRPYAQQRVSAPRCIAGQLSGLEGDAYSRQAHPPTANCVSLLNLQPRVRLSTRLDHRSRQRHVSAARARGLQGRPRLRDLRRGLHAQTLPQIEP